MITQFGEKDENIQSIPAVMMCLFWTVMTMLIKAILKKSNRKMRTKCPMAVSPRVKTTTATTLADSEEGRMMYRCVSGSIKTFLMYCMVFNPSFLVPGRKVLI